MAEPLNSEIGVFLRSVRKELLNPPAEGDPFGPLRAQRLAAALDHIIMRAEQGDIMDSQARESARALLADFGPENQDGNEDHDGSRGLADAAVARALIARENGSAADNDAFVAAVRQHSAAKAQAIEAGFGAASQTREDVAAGAREETPPLTAEAVTEFLRVCFPDRPNVEAVDFVRPAGVYSKENYSFTLVGLEDRPVKAILRRDRGFEIIPTSASGEFELLNALYAQGQPVARCIAAQTSDEAPLHGPCLIMERIAGSPPGMARTTPDDKLAWADMILQLAPALASLHAVDAGGLPLPGKGRSNRETFLATLDDYRDRLHRYQREAYPLIEAAFVWLYSHADLIDERQVMVHGDYDMRNVLFDGDKLNAILDFELAHIGHPAEDLGYVAPDVLEVMPYSEFLSAYRAAGGADISPALIHYFHVWRWTFHGVCNIVAFSGYRSGIHDDIFLGTVSFVEFRRVQEKLMDLLPGGRLFVQ